jgi:uncharacterized protein YkwD
VGPRAGARLLSLRRGLPPLLLLALVGCATRELPPCSTSSFSPHSAERAAAELVNRHRRAESLPPLAWSADLADLARAHSQDLAVRGGKLSHRGFRGRFEQAAARAPTQRFGENITQTCGATAKAADTAVANWLDSTPHRRNIEGDFRRTGIGVARDERGWVIFTQLFASP